MSERKTMDNDAEETERVVTAAIDSARSALRVAIGERPAAYDKADKFMEVFEPMFRGALYDLGYE